MDFLEKNRLLLVVLAVIWSLPWKAVVLWRSARRGQRVWFGAILVINTLGILEMFYLWFFLKKEKSEEG